MCGLVGVFGDVYKKHLDYFKQALVTDFVRGKHSTGVTFVKASGIPFNKKLALDPVNFLQLNDVDSNLSMANVLMMGHNRHATFGAVNSANAHPFEHGNISLMHNGTLTNKDALKLKYSAPEFGTDSELVCWLVNEHGIEGIIGELQGAFALTWWDKASETFNCIRNDEREFNIAVYSDVIFYASERLMLEWLLKRNGFKVEDATIYQPKAGEYHVFSYEKKAVSFITQQLKLKPPYVPTYTESNYGNWRGYGGNGGNVKKENVSELPVVYAKTDRLAKFNRENNCNIKDKQEVFAYLESTDDSRYPKKEHVDLTMTLVNSPYSEVKAYYVPKSKLGAYDRVYAVCGNVSHVRSEAGKADSLVLCNTVEAVVEGGYHWRAFNEALEEEGIYEEDDQIMIGANDALITEQEFLLATSQGCAVCSIRIDQAKEIEDEQTCTVVSETSAVCAGCVDIYEDNFKAGVN